MQDVFLPRLPEGLELGWAIEGWVFVIVAFVVLVVKVFALVSALLYSNEAYHAADKLNKTTWCAILGVGVLLHVVPVPLTLVNLALLVAALVYLADVRPALAGLRRR
ncbi:uncharacterized protein DUF2516 [Nocardioides sp. J9]|uniref:DUF2516 family protein n=1 Tax=unclassified Nocardioides TaxID=2615069 RepID=UPI0004BB4AA3|nr:MULTISPECIES: DUF2516 family protein [unclassified Nocardioides]TWG93952.1 uncharacterized protein DUF2516 [Nocardioides sp. J9]